MQIRTTMRHHYRPTRMAKIKSIDLHSTGEDAGELDSHAPVGMQDGAALPLLNTAVSHSPSTPVFTRKK